MKTAILVLLLSGCGGESFAPRDVACLPVNDAGPPPALSCADPAVAGPWWCDGPCELGAACHLADTTLASSVVRCAP